MNTTPTDSRRRVRRVFVAVLIVLPVQYGLVGLIGPGHGEPWPALVMPGFQRVYDPDEIRTDAVTFIVTFGDGSTTEITPVDLLSDLPRSHHGAVLAAQFRPGSGRGFDAPGKPAGDANSAEAVMWLRRRIGKITSRTNPVGVDAVWTDVVFASGSSNRGVTRQVADTLSISLR